MPVPVITLTTDFGTASHYVGTMKGVILRIAPGAQIVDISHQGSPYDVVEGSFVIAQASRYFPPKTVHVVVVDPGVGTSRRPIAARVGGQYFIAPDNGVLSMVFRREPAPKVRAITAEKYFLKPLSSTFHGRDLFAPTAAHLAAGAAFSSLGPLIKDYLNSQQDAVVRTGKRFWTGRVLTVDRFGNLITNFTLAEFPALHQRPFEFAMGPERVTRLVGTFADCASGELVVIEGSSGYLEVVSNQASAAKMLGYGTGAPVELTIW